MELNELRIGNNVYFKSDISGQEKVLQVDWVFFSEDFWIKNSRPIPITEEWLVKFGWVWNEECNSFEKHPNGDARMHLQYRDVSNSYSMFNYVLKALIADRIFYVHQLQNLYFALTGEEL